MGVRGARRDHDGDVRGRPREVGLHRARTAAHRLVLWQLGRSHSSGGHQRPERVGSARYAGKVEEWVWDCYGQYVVVENSIDPLGLLDRAERVTRGGSFEGFRLRLASRSALRPEDGNAATGFRLARSVP